MKNDEFAGTERWGARRIKNNYSLIKIDGFVLKVMNFALKMQVGSAVCSTFSTSTAR